jgi:hypothetical protein
MEMNRLGLLFVFSTLRFLFPYLLEDAPSLSFASCVSVTDLFTKMQIVRLVSAPYRHHVLKS